MADEALLDAYDVDAWKASAELYDRWTDYALLAGLTAIGTASVLSILHVSVLAVLRLLFS